MTGAKKWVGRGRKWREKGKGRGRRGSPLTSLPNPFSLFLSLSQSPTSSLPPLLRMLAWREELVCRPLVKGNEGAGYEGSPFPSHFDAFDAGCDQGWKTCIHTYLNFFSGKNVSGDFHQNLMKHESWRIKTFSVKGLAQNRMSKYL